MTSMHSDAMDEADLQAEASPPAWRGDSTLRLLFEERCQEVVELLSRRWWKWRRPWDAERRANLARLLADLGEARRLDAARRLPEGTREHLRTLLRRRIGALTFDGTLEVRDELRKALIPIGDERYIGALLETERARQADYDATDDPSALPWHDRHGADHGLDDRDDAARRLLAFSEARREQHREDRKGVQLRQQVMLALSPALAVLTVGAAVASALLIDSPDAGRVVLMVVCAGGLGALLGSVRLLREDLAAGADVRSYLPAVLVEPLLGAIAGLLVLLVGETGVLGPTIADGDVWARAGLLAFAAGFAEPPLLRAVSRIAGIPGDDLGPRPVGSDPERDVEDPPFRGLQLNRRGATRITRRGTALVTPRYSAASSEPGPEIRNGDPPGGRDDPPSARS